MRIHFLISLLLLLTGQGCIYEPGCEEPFSEGNIQVILHWPDTKEVHSGVFILFYPTKGGIPISDFLPEEGGRIYIPEGEYKVLAYTNNSETIDFREIDLFEMAEAYVGKDIQPDRLYSGYERKLVIAGPSYNQTIKINMVSLVKNYPFKFSGAVNMQFVDRIQIYISGIPTAVLLTEPEQDLATDSVRCTYTRTEDGFKGSFRSFGHGNDSIAHHFSVRFITGDMSKAFIYNVTEMLNRDNRIDIYEKIEFNPTDNGSFKPGVDDWEDDTAVVPL